jgi:hypothetical protein
VGSNSRKNHHGALARVLRTSQGLYFLVTGLWPLLHMRSFLAVTGPKTDLWLVKTVGALVAVIGGTLLGRATRHEPAAAADLAVGSAAALAAIDVVYVAQGRIARIYLLDAALEAAIIAAWGVALRRGAEGATSG